MLARILVTRIFLFKELARKDNHTLDRYARTYVQMHACMHCEKKRIDASFPWIHRIPRFNLPS